MNNDDMIFHQPELEWKMMTINQQHLTNEYNNIKAILKSQEIELILLWALVVTFGITVIIDRRTIRNIKKGIANV